jgi:hypothetical protein
MVRDTVGGISQQHTLLNIELPTSIIVTGYTGMLYSDYKTILCFRPLEEVVTVPRCPARRHIGLASPGQSFLEDYHTSGRD